MKLMGNENQNTSDTIEKDKVEEAKYKMQTKKLNLYYGDNHVIKDVDLGIKENTVTAFIGPSGCGKSTVLRTLNRMNDYIEIFKKKGDILLDGKDIYHKKVNVEELRQDIGMVFQKPNPFPKSIYENVVYGLKIQGNHKKTDLDEVVESTLKQAALWDLSLIHI